jgi:hypothetical protein
MKIEHVDHVFDHEETRLEKFIDIWRNVIYMKLLTNDGFKPKTCDLVEKEMAKRKVMRYN